jgi:intracellular multiplication protein IcmP
VNLLKLFASQLGYVWQGADKLPVHNKALFSIFAAIANQDRKPALDLLRQINYSLEYKTSPNFTGFEELYNKYKDSKIVKKIESRHAYVMTVMAALLAVARTDGVLATADFLWLKEIDRPMWYMLNNVGRRAAFPEVAGAIAHWRIETRMQRKLMTPMIEEAVKALKIAIEEIIYPEDED